MYKIPWANFNIYIYMIEHLTFPLHALLLNKACGMSNARYIYIYMENFLFSVIPGISYSFKGILYIHIVLWNK